MPDADDAGTAPPARPAGPGEPGRRRMKLSEALAARILDDITAGGLPEGAALMPEAAMVRSYGAGRESVREALRILETNGLVTIKAGPRGGAVVGGVDPVQFGRMASRYFQLGGATMRDIIGSRLVLEPAAAALAAGRRDPVDMGRLRDWLDATGSSPVSDDQRYRREVHEFHRMLAGMSGNLVLDLLSAAMTDVFTSRVRVALFPARARRHVQEVHRSIAGRVLDGDRDAAAEEMRVHLQETAAHAARRLPGLLDELVSWH